MMAQIFADHRVLVCVGTGGVGKTTVAAALAIGAAALGRKVAVMTIDPSKRLSQALGIDAHNPELQEVPLQRLEAHGLALHEGGSLHALMLDVQHTFDSLIRARAQTPSLAETILANRIYKHFSASLAGSHEYAAVEKLYDICVDPRFDLVVLDTPPSHHALDFLDAPGRILRFLQGQEGSHEGDDAQAPSFARRMGRKLFDLGGSLVTRTVGRVSGSETLAEVTQFLTSLKDMYASFNARAANIRALLQSSDVAFTLVGGPSPAQMLALDHFADELGRFNIKPKAWLLNRVRPVVVAEQNRTHLASQLATLAQHHPQLSGEMEALKDTLNEEIGLADRDAQELQTLRRKHADATVLSLPDDGSEADNLARLAGLSRSLCGS